MALLYVVGGSDGISPLDSVESYDPNSNTWTMMNVARTLTGVLVIERPHLKKWYQSCFYFSLNLSIHIQYIRLPHIV